MFNFDDLEAASRIVYAHMAPTPQYAWPLLRSRLGMEVVVKHENHTPIGAFKLRGGLVYMERLKRQRAHITRAVSATRGNHGQSLAFAAKQLGIPVTIVIPVGNSPEKNAAMEALGAELVIRGDDFDDAKEHALTLAADEGVEFIPSFHVDLVTGVATYARELFEACPDLDVVYAPIGLGSGICGLIRTRDLLGLRTEIVGVVSKGANTYRRSLESGSLSPMTSAKTFADGVAVRVPDPEAFSIISRGVARILEVADDEIAEAIRMLHEHEACHNLAEGAGAAALAGLTQERPRVGRASVILSGANIDRTQAACVLAGQTPSP